MKRVLVLAVLSLFLLTANLWAEDPPVIVLVEGENELPVFIVNELGQNVSSGVYLYQIRSGGYVKTMKMVLFE